MNKIKTVILYRVIQEWRRPVFERLADCPEIDLEVWYGCDFPGTKVVSTNEPCEFSKRKLFSVPVNFSFLKAGLLLPYSPFLFFSLLRHRPEVVICEGASNLFNNFTAFLYAKLFRKRIIQWGLGEIRSKNKSLLRSSLDLIIRPVEKYSDACIAYSSIGYDYYYSVRGTSEGVFTAVNVVDTDMRRHALTIYKNSASYSKKELSRSTFDILFVGALEANKNIEILVEAFDDVYALHKDVRLTIVGDGAHADRLIEFANYKKSRKNIVFTGKVTKGIECYFAHSDIFVLPGLGGLAVSDALCHGVPVICGIGDGCEADLVNSMNGIIDDQLDKGKIKKYLIELLECPDRLSMMKLAAEETTKKLNIANYIKQIMNSINYVVQKTSK